MASPYSSKIKLPDITEDPSTAAPKYAPKTFWQLSRAILHNRTDAAIVDSLVLPSLEQFLNQEVRHSTDQDSSFSVTPHFRLTRTIAQQSGPPLGNH
jgi:hypothetical protein